MQVGLDVTCIYANFGGCGQFGFGDIATFKNNEYSPGSSKNLINWNWLKNFMQVEVEVKCMKTNFDRRFNRPLVCKVEV